MIAALIKIFVAQAKLSLNKLERQTPEALDKALSRAKVGLSLGAFIPLAFSTMWFIGEHVVGLILAITLFANNERLFRKNKLALKFLQSARSQESFSTSEPILSMHGIDKDKNTLKNKLKNLTESKKDIDKRKIICLEAEEILIAILACLEAKEEIKVLNLGLENYFCEIHYVDNFCKSVVENFPTIFDNEKNHGVQIKKLVDLIVKNSSLSKSAAYDFIIGYFSGGKTVVKEGAFVFYTDAQFEQLSFCGCCGQIISIPVVSDLTGEEFCSDACLKIYNSLLTEEFKPNEKFSTASKLIGYGVDGLLTTSIASQYSANQKIFAIGGQGHGFAAEQANTYVDKLQGKNAAVVGDDNAKYGPDRLVDGQYIQTKYCGTAARSVGAMFDGQTGPYKYRNEDGSPMSVEVPKDQYLKAVETVEKAAAEGRIPGVSSENAHKLVIKGSVTYQQALNIVKFGTVEGLVFDLRQGVVGSLQGASISLLLNFSQSYWRTKNSQQAFQFAAVSASKVLVKQTTTFILVNQLQRLSFIQKVSVPIPQSMNSMLAKGFGVSKSQVSSAAKGMMVANAVVISWSVTKDMYHVINDQMSGGQFFKNTMVTTTAVVAGSAGAVAGKVIGVTLGSAGGPIGMFLGGAIGGYVASKVTKSLLDEHIEDDKVAAVRLVRYQVNYLSDVYMMTPEETQIIVDNVVQDAFNLAPTNNGLIKMNEIILSHVIYLVKRRPKVGINEFEQAVSQIGFAAQS